MICLTVTPTSRQLAKVDLLNAAARADVVELCLDKLVKEPDVGDILSAVDKPVIVSCRREQEGGHYRQDDEKRLAMLRQAIVAGPAYVELDPETAKQVPPFGETKRIISYVSKDEPVGNVDRLYDRLVKDCRADIVKFSWKTDYLEEAWSLLAAVSKKRATPVVGAGIGRASRMLQILGMRYGAHWVYAALEPEMAVHPNDATLFELESVYDTAAIDSGTLFLGLVGFPQDEESRTVRVLNAGFRAHDLPYRCLPLQLRRTDRCREMFEKLKLNALVVHPEAGIKALGIAEHVDESARQAQAADLVFKQKSGWTAYNTYWRNATRVIAESLPDSSSGAKGLEKRNVLLVGAGGMAQALAYGITKAGGTLSVSGPEDEEAQQVAQMFSARHVPFASMYETLTDVVVFADAELRAGVLRGEVNPGFLRPSMTVLDVTRVVGGGDFHREANERGCRTVDPRAVYARQLSQQFESFTRRELPEDALATLDE